MKFDLGIFFLVFFIQWLWSGLGITLCYHRSLTHRAFIMPKWLEHFWVWGAYLAFQGSPIEWCSFHVKHHQTSDTPRDIHSPVVYGFWQSFMGWIYKTHYFMTPAEANKLVPWLAIDPLYQWMGNGVLNSRPYRMFAITVLHSVLIGYFFGAYIGLATAISKIIVFFSPLLLNSVCHMSQFGYRNFNTGDESQNVWFIALISQGEGWHNSHHAFPRRAANGFVHWWEIDVTYLVILLLEKLGLAKNVIKVSDSMLQNALIKK